MPTDVMRAARPLVATGVAYELSDGRKVLDDVALALAPGTMTALTGPSGAGKSTLLWILAGALAPTSGTVMYAAAPVGDRVAAARAGIVLVPQGVALVTALTARENLVVPLLMHGVGAGEAHARADAALASVLLAESGNHLVEELSGGEQQRVGVARALALRHSVLLADEPTSELDGATRETIVALLRAEADAGAVVLLATHDSWCADQADAEYHLDEGSLRRVR